jgi:hypothetical protein
VSQRENVRRISIHSPSPATTSPSTLPVSSARRSARQQVTDVVDQTDHGQLHIVRHPLSQDRRCLKGVIQVREGHRV